MTDIEPGTFIAPCGRRHYLAEFGEDGQRVTPDVLCAQADERFKSRLKLAIIVIIIFVILLASGSLNAWIDAPCLDCVRGS